MPTATQPKTVTIADISAARERLRPVIRETPVLFSHTFSARAHEKVFLKAECLQRTGSFKIRGAYNRLRTLPEGTQSVVCVSAGNHGQGVALGASLVGIAATVVMPVDAPLNKVARTRGYGAEVILHGRNLEQAHDHARHLAELDGLTFVHPFDDPAVIAGQGTLGLELLEQVSDLDAVVVPIGGGGLISGVATAIKSIAPSVKVIGVQAKGAAAAYESYHSGRLVDVTEATTLADGVRVARVTEQTLALMRQHVDDIVTVSDEEITEAVVWTMDRSKLVVEGAGAAGVAAIVARKVPAHGRVCVILSGGNIDLTLMARLVERGLTRAERYSLVRMQIPDAPGSLMQALAPLAQLRVNILDMRQHRAGHEVPIGFVDVELLVETKDRRHAEEIVATLVEADLKVEFGSAVP